MLFFHFVPYANMMMPHPVLRSEVNIAVQVFVLSLCIHLCRGQAQRKELNVAAKPFPRPSLCYV